MRDAEGRPRDIQGVMLDVTDLTTATNGFIAPLWMFHLGPVFDLVNEIESDLATAKGEVAGEVAPGVVELLEVVEVHEEHAPRLASVVAA